MIKKIFNFLNNLVQVFYDFYKKEENEIEYKKPGSFKKIDFNLNIPNLKSLNEIKSDRPTILLMDDFPGIISILIDDFNSINPEIKNYFNILYADGNMAAFSVKKFLHDYKEYRIETLDIGTHNNYIAKFSNIKEIDLALLDITIGGYHYNTDTHEIIEYDGIDIAKFLKEEFKNINFYFITGHIINKRNPKIFKFVEKFFSYFNKNIDDFVIPKNSTRIEFYKKEIKELCKKYNLNLIID